MIDTAVLLTVVMNTLALLFFVQSFLIGIVQTIQHHALEPPIAPDTDTPSRSTSIDHISTYTPTQAAVPRTTNPYINTDLRLSSSKMRLGTCCSSTSNPQTNIYNTVVPYLSTWVFTIQAMLGIATSLCTLIWQLGGLETCNPLVYIYRYGLYLGLGLLFIVSAIQTHLVNDRCVKIFVILLVGLFIHFGSLGLEMTKELVQGVYKELCVVQVVRPGKYGGWLINQPMFSAIGHAIVFFFSGVSFINATSKLCVRSRFLSFRETVLAMAVYRGIGLLFLASLFGLLSSAVAIGMVASNTLMGEQNLLAYWAVLEWSMLGRLMGAALWHRQWTDGRAHMNAVWRSPEYLSWYASDSGEDVWKAEQSVWSLHTHKRPALSLKQCWTVLALACRPVSGLAVARVRRATMSKQAQTSALSFLDVGYLVDPLPLSRHGTVVAEDDICFDNHTCRFP